VRRDEERRRKIAVASAALTGRMTSSWEIEGTGSVASSRTLPIVPICRSSMTAGSPGELRQ
jgi:hypothetical protein